MTALSLIGLAPILLALAVGCAASDACECGKPKQAPIRTLVLIGGASHDFEGLTPILMDLLERSGDFAITLSRDRADLRPESLERHDLLVMHTQGGDLEGEQREGLLGFVTRGGGLVGVHSGTATFKTSDDFWKLVGGRFTTHKRRDFEVRPVGRHEITAGLRPFSVFDEDYNHDFHPEAKIEVIAERDNAVPVMWTRKYGDGRVFINALGHFREVWDNRNFQIATVRGCYWAARRTPVYPVTAPKSR